MEYLVLLTTFLLCWKLISSVERIKVTQIEEETMRLEMRLNADVRFIEHTKEAE